MVPGISINGFNVARTKEVKTETAIQFGSGQPTRCPTPPSGGAPLVAIRRSSGGCFRSDRQRPATPTIGLALCHQFRCRAPGSRVKLLSSRSSAYLEDRHRTSSAAAPYCRAPGSTPDPAGLSRAGPPLDPYCLVSTTFATTPFTNITIPAKSPSKKLGRQSCSVSSRHPPTDSIYFHDDTAVVPAQCPRTELSGNRAVNHH